MNTLIIEHTNDWYGGKIPPATSPSFAHFFTGNMGIARTISPSVKSIRVEKGESAYADREKEVNQIVVPAYALTAYGKVKDGNVMSIAMANGLITHEAAHFRYSPATISEILVAGGYTMWPIKRVPSELATCANLVEDVFVEWAICEEFPYLKPFIEAAHNFFLELPLNGRTSLPDSNPNEIIAAMITSKSWVALATLDFGHSLPFIQKLMVARTLTDLADRGRLAISLYNDLYRGYVEKPIEPKPSASTEKGDGTPQTGDASTPAPSDASSDEKDETDEGDEKTEPKQTIEQEQVAGTISEAPQAEELEARKKTYTSAEAARKTSLTESDVEKINEAIQDEQERASNPARLSDAMIGQVPTKMIEIAASTRSIVKSTAFAGLGRRLAQRMTSAHVAGQALPRGRRLVNTRLSRIVTDGKIFANDVELKKVDRKWEFEILVDMSGSMNSGNKKHAAFTAAASAFDELAAARLKVRLWGHAQLEKNEVAIYAIANGQRDSAATAYRKAQMAMDTVGGGNVDGYAIKRVSDFISKDRKANRVLIVVSDGSPNGHTPMGNYGSDNGGKHTQRVVDGLRSQGIVVISITVDRGANDANDIIYGRKNNVKSNDPSIMAKLIGMMVH